MQPVEKGISFCQNARDQSRKLERAQAARALPFPFGRKRKQKGPFRTALRQREDRATLKPVRRTFPNSTIHIVSNTWEGSFLPLPCAAGAKIPSRATQKDSAGAASAFRKLLNAQSAAGNERFLQPFVAWKPLRRSQVMIALRQTGGVAREGISSRSGETKRLLV